MSNSNPIIQNTPAATLNSAIESLAFVNGMIKNTIALAKLNEAQGAEEQKQLTTVELAGFSLHIECVQAALESGFEQCDLAAKAQATA
jgi:hypothetical protein